MKATFIKMIALSAVAVTLFGCHDGSDSGLSAPAPNTNNSENFSTLAEQLYAESANSTPFNYDKVTIVYDVDNSPTAFDALLM